MSTNKHTDLESLVEDLRLIANAETKEEKQERVTELLLKVSKDDLDKLSDLAYLYERYYTKTFGGEI